MERSAQWIADAVGGRLVGPDVAVTGPIVTDSREAGAGSLYIARRGETSDGHDYAASALERGAVALLVERVLDLDPAVAQIEVAESTEALGALARAHLADLRSRGPLRVIAMTGSAGKTTTKDLLYSILRADAPTVAPKLSFNNEVGLPLTVLTADEDTRWMVLEMGASGPGHIAYLTRIAPPDVAIELMVGHAHLGGFGSVEGIANAKAELLTGSVEGASAILNADDPRVLAMAPLAKGPVRTFSAKGDPNADVRARDIAIDDHGRARFVLEAPEGTGAVRLGVVGAHHVNNALAAISGALVLGLDLDAVLAAVNGQGALSPHRMDVVDLEIGGVPFTLIDDAYNANLDSMRAGLAALETIGEGRPKFAVLSEMLELGEESAALHREVGAMAALAGAKSLVVLGADAPHYLEGARGVEGEAVGDVEAAADALCARLEPRSVVLVKGSYGSESWKVADLLREKGAQR